MERLKGKIGQAIAKRFAPEGANVALNHRQQGAEPVVPICGGQA